ncbi:hypothetical protein DFH09DRAFT_1340051 [Mycena vulgaris]|nr:hypothetical protein DFH09DRAFT_1340051 [Mycena vulgaris]
MPSPEIDGPAPQIDGPSLRPEFAAAAPRCVRHDTCPAPPAPRCPISLPHLKSGPFPPQETPPARAPPALRHAVLWPPQPASFTLPAPPFLAGSAAAARGKRLARAPMGVCAPQIVLEIVRAG